MQSDLYQSCAEARAHICVPAVPIVAIRSAANRVVAPRPSGRRRGLIALLLAGLPLVAVAAVAQIWNATHVSLGANGQLQLSSSDRLRFKKDPSTADVLAAARQSAFPVQLPVGLPAGSKPFQMVYGRSIILMTYDLPGAWRRSNHLLWIALVDPRSVGVGAKDWANGVKVGADGSMTWRTELGGTAGTGSVSWLAGREMVIVPNSTITPAELAHFKAAMLAQASRLEGAPGPR